MGIDVKKIYKTTWEHYLIAKKNVEEQRRMFEHSAVSAISDVIPDFEADKLEFGSYDKGNFAVLFVDMRDSTARAQAIGAEKTFLTMHIYLTALLEVVKHYHGKVIDIMGDGLMVFWGGREAREKENMVKTIAIQNAGLCGRDMLIIREQVINEIIQKENLGANINIGIGVTFDSVIVTKIGIPSAYDVKAFGDCINVASKYSNKVNNQVKVSRKVREEWPKSKGGKISFAPVQGEDAYILS
ncbi:MAG: adenylate/guanylate cyclase domain-containing protein [Ruminococcus sp.]|nr:adenylate/guanylate cyclase domain-containing protein [Ruminococcus sp.]